MAKFQPGNKAKAGMPKTGGRKKGTPNKLTREIKQMVEGALATLGGEKWLVQKANEEPAAFMTLLGKCIPKDVKLGGGLQLKVNLYRANDGRPAGD